MSAEHETGKLEHESVELRDGSKGTIFYLSKDDVDRVPEPVLKQMQKMYNEVIEEGRTYPYLEQAVSLEDFRQAWLLHHFTVLVAGDKLDSSSEVLGTYYVKPNYAGRCSHVSNAGFLVSTHARGKGLAKVLGKSYISWAPRLGYKSSVFNLVFETNVASWRAWESLGFTKLGVVPGVAQLKGIDHLVDAYIYGMTFSDAKTE